jgi:hypothetical protein
VKACLWRQQVEEWLNGVSWRGALVSRDCGVAEEALIVAQTEWFSLGATLSIPYDSLIEKCSTLSVRALALD